MARARAGAPTATAGSPAAPRPAGAPPSGGAGPIVAGHAIANNEIAIIAWWLNAPIAGCLGFEITRIYDDKTERALAAWVPFEGQSNPQWLPSTTSVWPVQRFVWRDLTARKRRDSETVRPADQTVRYRIRPLVPAAPGLTPVPAPTPATYTGKPVALAYADQQMFVTNPVVLTAQHGAIRATFTNGILSGQWLSNVIAPKGGKPADLAGQVLAQIQVPGNPLRTYLAGDVIDTVGALLRRSATMPGSHVYLALYELQDQELIKLLVDNAPRVKVILSNTSQGKVGGKTVWDTENAPARTLLHKTPKLEIHDRMFNNGRIGHNKFAVLVDAQNRGVAVMTGSTNWTFRGLCAQSNNALIIESPVLAQQYVDYWNRLIQDTATFDTPIPKPLGASTTNKQGPALRTADATPLPATTLSDQTVVTPWFSPNTKAATKPAASPATPPDLADVFGRMRQAKDAILFAVFLPSQQGKNSVVQWAVDLGLKDPNLLVLGSVSDPRVLPNYILPTKQVAARSTGGGKAGRAGTAKKPAPAAAGPAEPTTFDQGMVHIVRADALTVNDLAGAFERTELLKLGQAIIHDKIVVVDPMSDDGFVVTGSHNVGFKASYENDENLVIIQNNPALVQAYAAHVLDVYDHYRFRAIQDQLQQQKKPLVSGFLSSNDRWQTEALDPTNGALARYLSGVKRPSVEARSPTT